MEEEIPTSFELPSKVYIEGWEEREEVERKGKWEEIRGTWG